MSADINTVHTMIFGMEMTNTETAQNFKNKFCAFHKAIANLHNECVCWGNNSYYTKESVVTENGEIKFVPIDLITNRRKLYELTDKTLTFEQFSILIKFQYKLILNYDRGAMSTILGNPQESKKSLALTDDDYDIIIKLNENKWDNKLFKSNKELIYKVGNALSACGFRNRFPYNSDGFTSSEKYAIIANVSRMLSSWHECNTIREESYKEEQSIIERAYNSTPPETRNEIAGFVNFCVKSSKLKHFDSRIHSHFEHCVIPAFKSNTAITKLFYKNGKGEMLPYSLDPSIYEYLKNHPNLWNNEKPVILDNLYILEMQMTHDKHHPNAFFPIMKDADYHRVQYLLGDNYNHYKFINSGNPIDDVVVSVENKFGQGETSVTFTDGFKTDRIKMTFSRGSKDETEYEFNVNTVRKNELTVHTLSTHNPNQYMSNIRIWNIGKNKCANLIKFTRKNHEHTIIVKEPAIVCSNENDNFKFYIRFNMNVQMDGTDHEINSELKWFGSSALPFSKTPRAKPTETPKNIERFDLLKKKSFNIIGIDLGWRAPYSYAIGNMTVKNYTNDVEIMSTGEYKSVENPEYLALFFDIKNTCKMFGIAKSVKTGTMWNSPNNFVLNSIKNAQEFYRNIKYDSLHGTHAPSNEKIAAYTKFANDPDPIATLTNMVNTCTDMQELKKNPDFLGNLMFKYVSLKFNALKNSRKLHFKINGGMDANAKWNNEFRWLQIIEQMKRVTRALSYFGTDNTRIPINLDTLTDYYNGCKDNFLKNIASSIAELAKANNCAVIVLEDLTNKSKVLNKRNENFMNSLWSPRRIKDAIANAASWYGIDIAEVSENMTSQIHYETGLVGYRGHGKNVEKLYINDSGDTVHADMNAAKNIIKRFVTRHASMCMVSMDFIFSNETDENQESNKRLRGFLTHKFGSVDNAKKFFADNGFKKEDKFAILNGDTWITLAARNSLTDHIKSAVVE